MLAVALASIGLTGCSPTGGPTVRLENQTTVPVAIYLDDQWIGTYPAGATVDARFVVPDSEASIEARTASGAVLVSILGTAAMIEAAADGSMPISEWADVPCGRVALSIGAADPVLTDPPPGPTGSCP